MSSTSTATTSTPTSGKRMIRITHSGLQNSVGPLMHYSFWGAFRLIRLALLGRCWDWVRYRPSRVLWLIVAIGCHNPTGIGTLSTWFDVFFDYLRLILLCCRNPDCTCFDVICPIPSSWREIGLNLNSRQVPIVPLRLIGNVVLSGSCRTRCEFRSTRIQARTL